MNYKKGFTLLEILLVVAALTILAGIVILAINPNKQLADTRNSERWMDVNTILNATYQYSIDNNGAIPSTITSSATGICKTGVLAATCISDGLVNLSALTTNEKYLVAIPTDPSGSSDNSTRYFIRTTTNGRIVVSAPSAEEGHTISVQR
jgi:prepilin-type N-terminal cleavage/methylation domain-containing protein